MSSTQLSSALQKLAQYRVQNSRQSQDVFDQGVVLLKNKNGSWARGNDNGKVPLVCVFALSNVVSKELPNHQFT